MGTKKEPTWGVRNSNKTLVAFAKRAAKEGWFVRISGVNGDPSKGDGKIYIDEGVFPPDFMKTMLEMNKLTN